MVRDTHEKIRRDTMFVKRSDEGREEATRRDRCDARRETLKSIIIEIIQKPTIERFSDLK